MARCPVCGRFYRPVDRLAEARADQFIAPQKRNGRHSPRSHGDAWRDYLTRSTYGPLPG